MLFYSHCAGEIENAIIAGYFRFVFQENSVREMTEIFVTFTKRSSFKMLSVRTKTKPVVFKFLQSEERFDNSVFADSLWTVGLAEKIKLRFQLASALTE